MDEGSKDQVSRQEYIQGIAISMAVFCLPSLLKEFGWPHVFCPLPVFYYFVCFGKKHAAAMIGISAGGALLIGAGINSLSTLMFSLTMLPLGFILAQAAYRRETVNKAGLKGIAYLVITWMALGGIFGVIHQVNPYTALLKSVDQGLQTTYSQYVEKAEVPKDQLKEIESAFKQSRQIIARMFPSFMLVSILFTVWINMVIGNWLLRKRAPSAAPWSSFRDWKAPEQLVWLVVLTLLGMLLPLQSANTVAFNTALVLGVVYFFQGLAVLTDLVVKWSVPAFFRVVIYALMIILGNGILLLALIGLADVWVDFRKKRPATGK